MLLINKYVSILGAIAFGSMIFMGTDYMELMASNPLSESPSQIQLHKQYRSMQMINEQMKILKENSSIIGKRDLILDLNDIRLGQHTEPSNAKKSLVVMAIGKSDKEGVDRLITKHFYSDNYTFLFFHYDKATYDEYEWYHKSNVIAIRTLHKMKFWYLKRFLLPNMAAAFSFIVILDADVEFGPNFNPETYQRVAQSYGLALTQPAHAPTGSETKHPPLLQAPGDHIGRYSRFIECGPAVWLSSEAYRCIYDLLQVDLTSGWGLDILWASHLIDACHFSNTSVAVIDAFQLIHAVPSSQGTASSNPGFNDMAWLELLEFKKRFPQLIESWGDGVSEYKFGSKDCIDSMDPKGCGLLAKT